ncbi:hypothetical protein KI387_038695, partial [Taxus chinensis]
RVDEEEDVIKEMEIIVEVALGLGKDGGVGESTEVACFHADLEQMSVERDTTLQQQD